jgi:hypothetical protein
VAIRSDVAADPGEVLARSLAEHEAYWNALGTLTPAQRRWSKFERKLRIDLAAKGEKPPEWLIAEIRCGRWEQRQQESMRNLLHGKARLARLKHEGYSFDAEHRLVAPALSRICAPERRENEARPRGRRAQRSGTSSRDGPGLGEDSDEPPPDLSRLRPLPAFARAYLKAEVDARRRRARRTA